MFTERELLFFDLHHHKTDEEGTKIWKQIYASRKKEFVGPLSEEQERCWEYLMEIPSFYRLTKEQKTFLASRKTIFKFLTCFGKWRWS